MYRPGIRCAEQDLAELDLCRAGSAGRAGRRPRRPPQDPTKRGDPRARRARPARGPPGRRFRAGCRRRRAPRSGRRPPPRTRAGGRSWPRRCRAGARRGWTRRCRRRRARTPGARPRRSARPSAPTGTGLSATSCSRSFQVSDGSTSEKNSWTVMPPVWPTAAVTAGMSTSVGDREPAAKVALAAPGPRSVDRQRERPVAAVDRLLDHRPRDAAVLEDVDLEPARRAGRGRALTSRGVLVAIVDSVMIVPASAAARAIPHSPSGCAIFCSATGATMTGIEMSVPRTVVAVEDLR